MEIKSVCIFIANQISLYFLHLCIAWELYLHVHICLCFNPFIPIELPLFLDRSISNLRDVWFILSITIYYRNSILNAKE